MLIYNIVLLLCMFTAFTCSGACEVGDSSDSGTFALSDKPRIRIDNATIRSWHKRLGDNPSDAIIEIMGLRDFLRSREGEPLSFEEVGLIRRLKPYEDEPYVKFIIALYEFTGLLETVSPSIRDNWWPSEVEGDAESSEYDPKHPLNILKNLALSGLPEAVFFLKQVYNDLPAGKGVVSDDWFTNNIGRFSFALNSEFLLPEKLKEAWSFEKAYFKKLATHYKDVRLAIDEHHAASAE
ncbi:MAG: hypothetical protein WCJ17_02015 [bacterium]